MLKNIPFHPIITDWFNSQFKTVSPPQKLGWPEIAKNNHTLIFAPTGSGKTLAAFLWCIDDLFRMGINTDKKIFEQNLIRSVPIGGPYFGNRPRSRDNARKG